MSNKENYLDYIPKKSDKIQWKELDNGLIQIIKPRNSLLDKAVRKLFFTPDKFVVDLDEMGSFIWKSIDGENNIYEISLLLKDEFKEKAEPLYERLIQYMNILKNNGIVDYV